MRIRVVLGWIVVGFWGVIGWLYGGLLVALLGAAAALSIWLLER